jgi:imidazolonepropionase
MSDVVTLWHNARIATCDEQMQQIEDAAILTSGGRIDWIGPERELKNSMRDSAEHKHDLRGAWLTPGLVDCHTHLVFAGTRAEEYAQRLSGVSYEEIAKRGGGIISTVKATRAASEDELFDQSAPRLQALLREGVTTLEIKSGYGLTLDDEAKMLRVARRLGATFPVTVKTTFLAAHALPPEYSGRPDVYMDVISQHWLPDLHARGLVDAVDVFCDRIGFTAEQSQRLFDAALALNLPVKMHAEQLANIGGTKIATDYSALSCDHLEHTTEDDVIEMSRAGTIAVLLPVAYFCLDETQRPPIDEFRRYEVPMALATDCNPGSAPGASLQLAIAMGMRLFKLDAVEALVAVTRNAARALGEHEARGSIKVGAAADFAIWDMQSLEELGYWIGYNRCRSVVRAGAYVAHRS